LLGNEELRHIYIIGNQQIGKEFVRMILIVFAETDATVKAIYREYMEHWTQERCCIPWKQAVKTVCRDEQLWGKVVRYQTWKGITFFHILASQGNPDRKGQKNTYSYPFHICQFV
jgi:hypothetical protein